MRVSSPPFFPEPGLVAYMVTCRDQNWLHILHQMSRREDLHNFPNHVLTYSVTEKAAADASIDVICYGYAPRLALDGLHEYKLRFGYEMVPHCSAVQLHPALNAMLNCPAARAALRVARRWRNEDQRLEIIDAVLEGAKLSGPSTKPC